MSLVNRLPEGTSHILDDLAVLTGEVDPLEIWKDKDGKLAAFYQGMEGHTRESLKKIVKKTTDTGST